jgi:hypothetical protein
MTDKTVRFVGFCLVVLGITSIIIAAWLIHWLVGLVVTGIAAVIIGWLLFILSMR